MHTRACTRSHTYTCAHKCTHAHARMHVCAHTLMHTCIHAHVYAGVHMHSHTCTCTCMCAHRRVHLHAHAHACTGTHIHMCMHLCTHCAHRHTRAHTCKHAHAHTSMRMYTPPAIDSMFPGVQAESHGGLFDVPLSLPPRNQPLADGITSIFRTLPDSPPPPRTSALPPECACLVLTSAGSSGSCPCPLQSAQTTAQTEDPVKTGHILSLLCPKPSTDGHLRVKPTSSGGQQLEWPMLANSSTGHPVKLNFRERSICMRRVQKISHHLSEIRVPYSPSSQTHEA